MIRMISFESRMIRIRMIRLRSFESRGNSCKVSPGCTIQFATKPAHEDVDDENDDVNDENGADEDEDGDESHAQDNYANGCAFQHYMPAMIKVALISQRKQYQPKISQL